MPKQEGQKTKLLALLHIFEQKTDENHLLNVPQLVELLEQQGILAERKSIYSDIDTLCALGYDIQLRRGRGGGYWMASRAFELSDLGLLVEIDRGDLRRIQRPLDQQLAVGRPIHDVDILVAQLLDNRVDARTFHAHAGADRIDPVVVRLDGHLGPFAGYADDLLDRNQAVVDFGNLHLEQPLEELGSRTRQHDVGRIVLHLDAGDDRLHAFAFAEKVARNLLGLGQHQLVVVVVQYQYLLLRTPDRPRR